MTKKEKNKLGVVHEVKVEKTVNLLEHNEEENILTTHETNHYKRGYMAHDNHNGKLGHCSECKGKSVSQEEFDKMVKVLLNTPPRKRSGKRK